MGEPNELSPDWIFCLKSVGLHDVVHKRGDGEEDERDGEGDDECHARGCMFTTREWMAVRA